MKKRLITSLCITVTMAFSMTAMAKSEKENAPNKKDVLKEMEEIGGEHYVEKMKMYEIGSVEVGSTYYHVFNGQLKDGTYHVIIYDNEPKYLGFYSTDLEPTGYEENGVEFDSGDGETYYILKISDKGPSAKARIGSMPVTFIKNPKLEAEAKTGGSSETKLVVPEKQKSESGMVIDYRDWTITMKGREIKVNAIFVKIDGKNVIIKNAKNGKEATIPGSALSDEDKEYVKQVTAAK